MALLSLFLCFKSHFNKWLNTVGLQIIILFWKTSLISTVAAFYVH